VSISGLVITLSDTACAADTAMAALAGRSEIELGPRHDRRLAATAETGSPDDDRRLVKWIADLDGVAHVDVVFVGLDDQQQAHPHPTGERS
jgi:hypothetical protein